MEGAWLAQLIGMCQVSNELQKLPAAELAKTAASARARNAKGIK